MAGLAQDKDLDQVRADYARASADWAPLPRLVQEAFIAAEDRSFRQLFPKPSTLTATITAWYPEPSQDREARWATTLALSQALSADEVLALYPNGIFPGRGCFGVTDAARAFFGTAPEDMTLAEAASLAALVKAPAMFLKDASRHLERRNYVLDQMVKTGAAELAEAESAKGMDLTLLAGVCAP
jgi:membrane peptidoglycan carboxypeptidase